MLQAVADTGKIAQAFVDARQAGLSLKDYPGDVPLDLSTAYIIQDAALSRHPGPIAGWKVGRINSPWLEKLGVSRLCGPIHANLVQHISDGSTATGHIFAGGFGAAEAEFVYRIGAAPKTGQTKFNAIEASKLIDAVYCGFEIASSPFAGINECGPLVTISDFGNNHGLLLGPEIENWQEAALEDWAVETRIDGELVGSGTAKAFPGGPLESVRFLIENLVARGITVEPGMLISSGAISGVHQVSAGQRVESRFGDRAILNCEIAHFVP